MVEAVWLQRYMPNNLYSQELLSLARDGRNIHYDLHLMQWHRRTDMMGRSHRGGDIWVGSQRMSR